MVAFLICCEGPCRPGLVAGGGCEGGAKENGTVVRERPAQAPPPAPRRAYGAKPREGENPEPGV